MPPPPSNQNNKLFIAIIMIVIGTYYSYILAYAFSYMAFMIITLGVISSMVLLSNQSLTNYVLKLPLSHWVFFYFVVNLIWLILPHSYATAKNINDIMIPIIYVSMIIVLLYFDDDQLTTARKTILFVTLLACANNLYELFNPDAFYTGEKKITGRSSGLYGNANGASEAIILGMILAYGMVPKHLKVFYLLFILVGIVPTFSRSGIASWFIIVFILFATKIVSKKVALTIGATVFISALIILPILINFLGLSLGENAENVLSRLDFFSSKSSVSDGSAQSRFLVAKVAFNYFADNPFLGAGHSFTFHWEHDISTHNMYLLLMAEFGLLGVIIYPLLLLSIIWKSTSEARNTGLAFTAFLFIIGFTSHNILEGFHTLLAIAVMASWSYKTREKPIPDRGNYVAH
jgi:hypothetical protein